MTNQTKDNTNPPQLHQFGSHFRYWREKRGYSLKEAAGDVMSVSQLSKFETEKITISINKLSDLLMMIGVDLGDFMITYPGQRVDKYVGLGLTQNYDEIPHYYQNFPHYQELIDHVIHFIKYRDLLTPEKSQLKIEPLDNILEQDKLNLLEIDMLHIAINTDQFPPEYLPKFAIILENALNELSDLSLGYYPSRIMATIEIVLHGIRHLSRKGYHQEALHLIHLGHKQLDNLPNKASSYTPFLDAMLQIFEVYTLIRMGKKTEAFRKRVETTQLLTSLAEYSPTTKQKKFYKGYLTQFSSSYQLLLDGRLK